MGASDDSSSMMSDLVISRDVMSMILLCLGDCLTVSVVQLDE